MQAHPRGRMGSSSQALRAGRWNLWRGPVLACSALAGDGQHRQAPAPHWEVAADRAPRRNSRAVSGVHGLMRDVTSGQRNARSGRQSTKTACCPIRCQRVQAASMHHSTSWPLASTVVATLHWAALVIIDSRSREPLRLQVPISASSMIRSTLRHLRAATYRKTAVSTSATATSS